MVEIQFEHLNERTICNKDFTFRPEEREICGNDIKRRIGCYILRISV